MGVGVTQIPTLQNIQPLPVSSLNPKPFISHIYIYIYIYGGFPILGVPFLGVPIIRTIVFWGLHWGPLILGNYHIYSESIPKT